jgi:hypothetical protein
LKERHKRLKEKQQGIRRGRKQRKDGLKERHKRLKERERNKKRYKTDRRKR